MTRWLASSDVVRVIDEAKNELAPVLARLDIEQLAKHNMGYARYSVDPIEGFVDQEIIRFTKTVDFIYKTMSCQAHIIDIGMFVPIVPVALAKLGFRVASVENLAFYGTALNEMVSLINGRYNIGIHDLDILNDELGMLSGKFDVVLLLAILEHLNGTPKYLLEKVSNLSKPTGRIIVEVPNAATLERRLAFLLKGKPPFPPFSDYYHSDYPFTGHNREYTVGDLKYALKHSGFEIVEMEVFHHNTPDGLSPMQRFARFLEQIGPDEWRPNIWAVAQKRQGAA